MISGGVNDSNQEFKLNDEWSSEEYGNVDKSLDDIIQKIEAIQSEVQQLKTRTDKVISESCGKFCSITQFSMRGRSDGFNHFDSTFTSNENTLPFSFPRSSSQLESEFHMGDLLMPGNASASREVMIPCIVTTDGPELDDPLKDVSFIYKHKNLVCGLCIFLSYIDWVCGLCLTFGIFVTIEFSIACPVLLVFVIACTIHERSYSLRLRCHITST